MTVFVGKRRFDAPLPYLRQLEIRPGQAVGSALGLLLALGVALLMLLPPAYLLLRAAESPQAALDILWRPTTIAALGRTLLLSAGVTLASCAIAVPVAWLTTQTDLRGRRFWAVSTALPLVLPSYVAAYLFVSTFGPRGVVQQLLQPLGVTRLPAVYGFWGALIVLTLLSYPYVLLSVRAAFLRLDPSLIEAGRSLGLSPWATFWRITLPQLRPGMVAGALLVALYVLRDFGAVSILRFDTFTRIIYIQYRSFSDRALSASLGLVLVAMTAVLLYLELRTRGRATYDRRSAGSARRARPVALGRWQWVAQALLALLLLPALGVPTIGLLYWLVRGMAQANGLGALWQPAVGSLAAALAAALVALLAALPVAVRAVRRGDRFSQWLERLTYTGFALPGIVIALALAFFSIRYANALYNTLLLLVIAYVLLFIPQAVGAVRTSLLQMPRNLEHAARSLGAHPATVLRQITLPLVTPGIMAGGALVFLTCMKELPATLILSPLGYQTLSIAVWSNISEAFFAQAAAPSLLLVLLSSLPLALLTFNERA